MEACDSTAVETGDDSSLLALTPSDESERSSTTADDISTEVKELGVYNSALAFISSLIVYAL